MVVDDFNDLGTVFNYTGNFNLNQEYLAGNVEHTTATLLKVRTKAKDNVSTLFVGSIVPA